jgi:hypothetical protein
VEQLIILAGCLVGAVRYASKDYLAGRELCASCTFMCQPLGSAWAGWSGIALWQASRSLSGGILSQAIAARAIAVPGALFTAICA